jgi:hypothetical protein
MAIISRHRTHCHADFLTAPPRQWAPQSYLVKLTVMAVDSFQTHCRPECNCKSPPRNNVPWSGGIIPRMAIADLEGATGEAFVPPEALIYSIRRTIADDSLSEWGHHGRQTP